MHVRLNRKRRRS